MLMFYDQTDYAIRFEWGLRGLEALAPTSDVIIIVDVLSFSTSVEIATARGAKIFPYAGPGDEVTAYAQAKEALLAGKRPGEGDLSLSPTSLLVIETGARLVLPSPNGSTLSLAAAGKAITICGCLRNAEAVAARAQNVGQSIAVIACGERWGDFSLRPSFEDMVGAGAIISYLGGNWSPEAGAAVAVFEGARNRLQGALETCASGKELIEKGLAGDVALAAQLNRSQTVPILQDDCYIGV
jgi:2-phosphosulfolactate phosphatase